MTSRKLVERVHVDAFSLNPYLFDVDLVDVLESDKVLAYLFCVKSVSKRR